jgi:cytosine/adenosine deaminase-related metal-dependent hydrolase
LAYEGPTICFVGTFEACRSLYPKAQVTTYDNCVLAPGFINAHMHLYGIISHGLSSPVKITGFESFLEDYWWPLIENRIDSSMIAAATEASALQLVDSGVTAVCDVLEAPFAFAQGLETEAAILKKLGLRAVLSLESSVRVSPDNGLSCLSANVAFSKAHRDDPFISSMLCLHTAFTCPKDFILSACRLAREHELPIQFHLNESQYEPAWCERHHGERTALWYRDIGLLDQPLLAAQCVQLSEEEIDALSSQREHLAAVHVPLSNCEVGGGIAPVPALQAKGLTVGLGTDGYINNFFETMRGAFLLHKAHLLNPQAMPARTVWKMATEDGAKAIYGSKATCGVLAEGKAADFQVISLEGLPTMVTEENIFDQLILYRNPQDVLEVYVGGQAVKKAGKTVHGDWQTAAQNCWKASDRLAAGKTENH